MKIQDGANSVLPQNEPRQDTREKGGSANYVPDETATNDQSSTQLPVQDAGEDLQADEFVCDDDLNHAFRRKLDAKAKGPLVHAILSFRRQQWVWTALLCLAADVGWVLIPTLLHYINRFSKREHNPVNAPEEQVSLRDRGFGLAVGLLGLQTFQYLCGAHGDLQLERLGERVRTTVVMQWLRKRLQLSSCTQDSCHSNADVEAVAIEDVAEEMADAISSVHRVWTLPAAVIVGSVILIVRLKAASVAGVRNPRRVCQL